MNHYGAIVIAIAVGLPVSVSAQKAKDAVMVDPKVHNVVFENDHVRVFEARASHPAEQGAFFVFPLVEVRQEGPFPPEEWSRRPR